MLFATFPCICNLPENPRVMHRPAPNAHARNAISINAFACAFDAIHIAISNHGNLRRCGDFANPVPVREAVIPLQTRTTVNREHFNALALGDLERFHHVNAIVVPANAALKRKRNLRRLCVQNRLHIVQNLLQTRQVPQKSRTAPLARHLRRRTPRIHFDEFRVITLGNLASCCRHTVRETPKNLHTKRALFRKKLQLLMSIRVEYGITIRRNKLRNQKSHAVARKHPAKPPKRSIGHSIHRTENRIGENLLVSEIKTDLFRQIINLQHLSHNYSQIFRNVNPKKIFNFASTITLSLC